MAKTRYTNVEKFKEDLIKEIKKIDTMKHMAKFLQGLAIETLSMQVGKTKKRC